MWKEFFKKLKDPSAKMLVVTYLVTALCIAWTIVMLVIGPVNVAVQIVSYVSYALAAITLAYAVYTIVATKAIPRLIEWIKQQLRAHRLTAKLMENYGFRTVFFSIFSLALTLAFAVYNGAIALTRYLPVWHGALAGYYIFLACMRGGILLYHGRQFRGKTERKERVEIRKFRNVGVSLCVVIISLSVAILQMVQADAGFDRPGLMIYVAAAYTVVKVTTSITNFLRARKHDDYTIGALRNVNLADTAVSVLALQTSMFHSFGDESVATGVFNAVTGAVVCVIVFALGLYMIIKGNMGLKKLKEEEIYGKQRKKI